jgi:hypothetical protein
MTWRRASITVAAAFIALGGTPVAASPAIARRAHRSSCVPHGSQTIAQDKRARVYDLPEYIEGVRTQQPGEYACVFRGERTTVLTPPRTGSRPLHQLGDFTLAGTTLAYTDYQHGIDAGCTSIEVLDLTTGRIVREAPQVGCTVDAGFVRVGSVTSLVVNESGCIAWILAVGRNSAESFEVHVKVPYLQPDRRLDASADISPNSLRLAPGSEITWLDAGQAMYAMCSGPAHP